MKFQMQVREVGKENAPTFTEYFDDMDVETQEQAQEYCDQVITKFNSSHYDPREPDREIVPGSVKITGPSDVIEEEDDWDDDDDEDDEDDWDEDDDEEDDDRP